MDSLLFEQACQRAIHKVQGQNGIGTLSEKTVHAVLKNYYAPNESWHEQRVANFVADAYTGTEIFEIQTRNFGALRRKLDAFLPLCDVTVVYPVAHSKYLRYIDKESGEISARRKSPKTGTPYAVFPELYRIKPYILHKHFHLKISLLDVEEYRFLDGWSADKKKGASRQDALPLALWNEIVIDSVKDYSALIPQNLPQSFSTKDFKAAAHVSQPLACTALNILYAVKAVVRTGKQGNLYLYEKAEG